MCNTEPRPTPVSPCFACLPAALCVLCVLYFIPPPCFFLAGSGRVFTMRKKGADPWNAMVRNSLSGRVKTSPLISSYRAKTKCMTWETLSHWEVGPSSASHVFVDCAPSFNLIAGILTYMYIYIFFSFHVSPRAVCGFESAAGWGRSVAAALKLTLSSLSAHLRHQQDWKDEVQDLRGAERILATLWLKVHPFINFVC